MREIAIFEDKCAQLFFARKIPLFYKIHEAKNNIMRYFSDIYSYNHNTEEVLKSPKTAFFCCAQMSTFFQSKRTNGFCKFQRML